MKCLFIDLSVPHELLGRFMSDERCVYDNVLHDAKSLSVDIYAILLTILMETSDQPNLPAERIFDTVMQLFRWVAVRGEVHVRHAFNLRKDISEVEDISEVVANRTCEHGTRYKGLVDYDAFWDEKRLRTLKDVRRATRHHHLVVEGIAPLLDGLKTEMKKEVKEWRE